jgi:hypothetical protein
MRKEVVAGGKDAMEVDNDFFLVPVKISDHQGNMTGQHGERFSCLFPLNTVKLYETKNFPMFLEWYDMGIFIFLVSTHTSRKILNGREHGDF